MSAVLSVHVDFIHGICCSEFYDLSRSRSGQIGAAVSSFCRDLISLTWFARQYLAIPVVTIDKAAVFHWFIGGLIVYRAIILLINWLHV